MNKIELKNKTFIEGFDDIALWNQKICYLGQVSEKDIELLYSGKTSEIPEELAKKCVLAWFFGKEFDSFEDYDNRSNGFNTAKESIRSACNQEYCIIYKTN